MDAQKLETLPPPPGVVGSLKAGFESVASHIGLILLPLVLDLFLWLGPRLSAGNVYSSMVANSLNLFRRQGFPVLEVQRLAENFSSVVDLLDRLNWFGLIHTIPIGIPSLMMGNLPQKLPLSTPLGPQEIVQMPTLAAWLGWTVLLTFAGWVGGGLYFRWVSGTTLGKEDAGISSRRAIAQTFLLSVIWVMGLLIVLLPVSMVMTVLLLISPLLANIAVFIALMLSFWLIVPLFFTPHGIFVRRQNALYSILSSLRMARFTLPSSGMFVLSWFLLSRGLNYLWSVPANDSWMILVGIAGHAFIATALLSASFVYYRDINIWLQTVFEQWQKAHNAPTQQA